jgi:hypothetical protein
MAELAFGRWTVTDVIGSTLPKKTQFAVAIDGDDLRFQSVDGSVDRRILAQHCRYDPYGKRNGYLDFGDEAVWLKADSDQAAVDLEAALRARYVPRPARSATPAPDPTGQTVAKAYHASKPEAAAAAMTADAERYAGLGYALVSQSWAEPNRSTQIAFAVGGVIVALFGLLFLAVIYVAIMIWAVAAVLFILSALSGGEGALLATFERRDAAKPAVAPAAAQAPGVPARDRLLELTQLRDDGLITEDEWAARREAILSGI